jgi:signal transduction histidine kinase
MRDLLTEVSWATFGKVSTAEICEIRKVIVAGSDAASVATNTRHVQVLVDVPAGIELPLARPRIEHTFFNMITNAFEAMPGGGVIRIRARTDRNYVLIEIEDAGPGSSLEIHDRLFEPFATADKANGLGLGLALSRRAVLDHRGDMWVEAAAGARFVMRFPLKSRSLVMTVRAPARPVQYDIPAGPEMKDWEPRVNA